jgi:hypothetical protein
VPARRRQDGVGRGLTDGQERNRILQYDQLDAVMRDLVCVTVEAYPANAVRCYNGAVCVSEALLVRAACHGYGTHFWNERVTGRPSKRTGTRASDACIGFRPRQDGVCVEGDQQRCDELCMARLLYYCRCGGC